MPPITDHLAADLSAIFADWGDTLTAGATVIAGIYSAEFVELVDMSGFEPTFLLRSDQLGSVAKNTAVTITSPAAGITAKAFVVARLQDMHDGTTKLLLREA